MKATCRLLNGAANLFYRTVAEGAPYNTPIVVLHGLFGSHTNWGSLSTTISRRSNRVVHAVDLRNHGRSPHMPTMTYKEMADDVHQVECALASRVVVTQALEIAWNPRMLGTE